MTTTDALAAFLAARLDETEAVALAASSGPWTIARADTAECDELAIISGEGGTVAGSGYVGGGVWDRADAEHIILHDPARTLREVQAHREILRRYTESLTDPAYDLREMAALQEVAEILAGIWSDHPDYRPDAHSAQSPTPRSP